MLTDMPLRKRLRLAGPLLLFLLLILGLGLWLYQLTLMSLWQKDLHNKLEPVKTKQLMATPQKNVPLLISNTSLPALPKRSVKQGETTPSKTPSPSQQQPVKIPTKQQQAELTYKPLKRSVPVHAKAYNKQKTTATNQQDAKAVLQQLQAASGLDLRIALPENPAQREQLLNYLYRCGGVQFAVLQNKEQNQGKEQQLVYLSPKRYAPTSQWLRVVSGSLSVQERIWLGSYQGQPIRLFPQGMDQRLAQYIATALQGQSLSSLRAQYVLTGSGLTLGHIKVNQQVISKPWLLQQSHCR